METVPIDQLKKHLSDLIHRAARGERFLITRHRRPVATLTAAGAEHLHVGKQGRSPLVPASRRATSGGYLRCLEDDRRGGIDR